MPRGHSRRMGGACRCCRRWRVPGRPGSSGRSPGSMRAPGTALSEQLRRVARRESWGMRRGSSRSRSTASSLTSNSRAGSRPALWCCSMKPARRRPAPLPRSLHAERAGAKVIAAGDGGQLPSVAAGGWFAAIARELGGPELRQVVRQRDRNERDALESLHDGDPEPYVAFKREGRVADRPSGRDRGAAPPCSLIGTRHETSTDSTTP